MLLLSSQKPLFQLALKLVLPGRDETALFFMGCHADYILTRASSSEADSVAIGNRRYFPRTGAKRPLATLAGGGLPKTSASPLSLMLFWARKNDF
ncbi:hypothetical protein MTO96_049659 [Rhipicephalus appendiculatus]